MNEPAINGVVAPALPSFAEPASLSDAATAIEQLGRSIHEHAYVVGKLLLWVKGTLEHGQFIPWIKNNVWFSPDTAERFMAFAGCCETASKLLEYCPGKNRTMRNVRHANRAAKKPEKEAPFHCLDENREAYLDKLAQDLTAHLKGDTVQTAEALALKAIEAARVIVSSLARSRLDESVRTRLRWAANLILNETRRRR